MAPECGTYAAYQRHKRRVEPIDDACREANRVYAANYRASNPQARTRDRTYGNARHRALQRLRQRHPAEFNRLLAEEIVASQPPGVPGLRAVG
jgi:hypothetical protein